MDIKRKGEEVGLDSDGRRGKVGIGVASLTGAVLRVSDTYTENQNLCICEGKKTNVRNRRETAG